jgi:hypothetical protein
LLRVELATASRHLGVVDAMISYLPLAHAEAAFAVSRGETAPTNLQPLRHPRNFIFLLKKIVLRTCKLSTERRKLPKEIKPESEATKKKVDIPQTTRHINVQKELPDSALRHIEKRRLPSEPVDLHKSSR